MAGLTTQLHTTSGFVQLGLEVETIIGSAYPSFGFGDGILLGSSASSAFRYKFSFSSGQTVGQSPTAQSLERCASLYMNILASIKNIFSKTQPVPSKPVVTNDMNAYVAKQAKEIEEEARLFIDKYGSDFDTFFYRPNFDTFIRTEILPFRQPDSKHNNFLDNSYWNTKHPFNFPGPFYTGESDTCGTGDVEAPNNVMYDENAMEFIFK